ncbi:unnamed protein product [Arctogadus glacialis]
MPVRRGHVAPQNTFLDTIIRKFDSQIVLSKPRCAARIKASLNQTSSEFAPYVSPPASGPLKGSDPKCEVITFLLAQ